MRMVCRGRIGMGAALIAVAAMVLVSSAEALGAETGGVSALRSQGKAFAQVAKRAKDAVVFIQVEKAVEEAGVGPVVPFNDPFDLFNDDFFDRFFRYRGPPRRLPEQRKRRHVQTGQGSGFTISPDGYILTNNHVVGEADRITVKTVDGKELTAKLVGTDPQTDVAVIKVEAEDLPVLPLGDSDSVEVGEWVIAVGNPFGLAHTVTVGVVSAKGRSAVGIVDYEDFIQTDAAINPGNSGGPLINLAGEAIGINTAIFSRSGGYMGIGFAIPINMAKKIYTQLVEKGKIDRGFLGIMIQDLNADLAGSFGIEDTDGILVAEVQKGSPAEKGGLRVGDVIVELDGEPVKNVGPFRNKIALTAPGTKVKLAVLREGRRTPLTVRLGELDQTVQAGGRGEAGPADLGFSVQDLTPELATRFGYAGESGVLINEV